MNIIDENDFINTKIDKNDFSKSVDKIILEQNSIKKNDIVIHINYGIGKFLGLESVIFEDISKDFIKLEYSDAVKLLVPVENFDLITKYSDYDESIKLDRLGSGDWNTRKKKFKIKLKNLAEKLIKIASQRKLKNGRIFSVSDELYEEFCKKFPFEPTPDQIKATNEILNDLSSGCLMDRLLCGDVGFGKTEVIMRASFVVVKSKYKAQVAVVAPTTILCRQHYKNFLERFKDTDVKIASLSRFNSPREINEVKRQLEKGEIDIIIGTHALLNKNIKFRNLGLTIIDEEQRFGTLQKEKLRENVDSHILSMSATPIPRTLQMSIAGLKDLSIIATPPIDRKNVKTIVCEYNDNRIKSIIEDELSRKGRIFFVVPRIADIYEIEERLKYSYPTLKYGVMNGKMKNDAVDEVMNDFYGGKFSVLLATSIVENGIDIEDANTMIIYRANNFGLAQLYQLRGRVGRGNKQAFAYLTTKKNEIIGEVAKKRLDIMESIDDVNSSFVISSADMDIRGAGNILGEEQSGYLKDVGIGLYNKMLKEEIEHIKAENDVDKELDYDFSPEIKINVSNTIPNNYIENINVKMKFYKKIADAESLPELKIVKNEIEDLYGKLPESVENLMKIMALKIDCKKLNIQKVTGKNGGILINFYNNKFSNPDTLLKYIFSSDDIKLQGEGVFFKFKNDGDILNNVKNVLEVLMELKNKK